MKLKEVKKEVRGFIKKWKPRLYLDIWDIDVEYFDGPIAGFEEATAVCTPNPSYFQGKIRINYEAYRRTISWRREAVIVHELLHLVVSPAIEDQGNRQAEQLVSTLAAILCRETGGQTT